jgi:predicted Zn finger-like uncharacterized protein
MIFRRSLAENRAGPARLRATGQIPCHRRAPARIRFVLVKAVNPMILTCSSCGTRYLIDPAQLGDSGRVVRCAKCGHSWVQAPSGDRAPAPDLTPSPTSNVVSGNLPVPARPRKKRLPVLTWLGLSAVVLVAVAAAVQGRDAIVEQWPYAERLYRAAGFTGAAVVEEQGSDSAAMSGG